MTEKRDTVYRGFIEGHRWARLQSMLRTEAMCADVDIELTVDKGWIMETVWYKVSGQPENVAEFRKEVKKTIAEYEKRVAGIDRS
jgi:hypothetical protein